MAKSSSHLQVLRLPGETRVVVFGGLPVDAKEEETEATVPRPSLWFATALREALVRAGVVVTGAPRGIRWPETFALPAQAVKIGEVTSPPLRDMVNVILKVSQNLRTDLLFAYLGERRRKPDSPAWRTSDELALAELNDFLRENSLRAEDVTFDDGSGLSRNNLTTAAATVSLLQFMARHRESEAFAAGLPVAGVDGTLRRRMKGSEAEGKVQAKTGTLRWANALSGYVTTAAGERLAFSLMLNRNVAPRDRSSREDIDEIAVTLARHAGRE